MANVPSTFPFLVGSPDSDQAEERAGGSDTFPGPPNLPLVTGPARRHWPLYDNTTRTIRMWVSLDTGATWTQKDKTHAPITPANGTGATLLNVWQYFNAVWDGNDIVYVVAWDATFFVALFPFRISTNAWQASIVSTFTYLDQSITRVSGIGGMAACFRPFDGSVWMAFQAGGLDNTDVETLWGAKCIPGGAGWDGALTRIGGTYQDGVFHTSGSMALDPATNKIHVIYQRSIFGANATFSVTTVAHVITASSIVTAGKGYPFPTVVQGVNSWGTTGDNITGGAVTSLGPTFQVGHGSSAADGTVVSAVPSISGNGSLVHRVIKTDNTLTAEETVFNLLENDISQTLSNLKISGGFMAFTFSHGIGSYAAGSLRKVARAVIGDAPGWEVTTPAAANGQGLLTLNPSLMDTARNNGNDFALFAFEDSAGNIHYQFVFSPGIGSPWSGATDIAFADNKPGPVFYGADVLSIEGSIAIGMPAGSDWGWGYWELAAIAGIGSTAGRFPLQAIIPFPIKRCLYPRTRKRDLVHCVQPSKDGRIYVPVKTVLIDKECC